MEDVSEETNKSIEYESDADGVSAPWWMARRMEASSDDDDQEYSGDGLKEKCMPCFADLHPPNNESDGSKGSPEWYQELGGKAVFEEELEEMSQGDEEELQVTAHHVAKKKEKDAATVRDDAYVPTRGSFYMHDDRFLSPRSRYSMRRGIVTGMKLWNNCTDEPRWKHDKFEDMKDNGLPMGNDQPQMKNQTKGQRCMKKNQFVSFDNHGNQRLTTIFKGRGPKKYKPSMKCNNLNSSSKHQIHEKLKESPSTSSSSRVYRASSHIMSRSNHEQLSLHPGNEYNLTSSAMFLPTNSSVETLHQTTNLGGSFLLGDSPLLLLPAGIHHGGLPCGAVDDHALITLTEYAPQYSLN
ncbi:hypothetical protein PIB30_018772 [Stylosanthes scabra]|uniref:Btz domain-containing protein n=1 Tax=Stylosanthes scabra TaxID=79078 RepID=A0ABU6Q8P4_9FABA|nr:hypothetical protein [Stylosanthes scabra]